MVSLGCPERGSFHATYDFCSDYRDSTFEQQLKRSSAIDQTRTDRLTCFGVRLFRAPRSMRSLPPRTSLPLRAHAWTLWSGVTADSTQTFKGAVLPIGKPGCQNGKSLPRLASRWHATRRGVFFSRSVARGSSTILSAKERGLPRSNPQWDLADPQIFGGQTKPTSSGQFKAAPNDRAFSARGKEEKVS